MSKDISKDLKALGSEGTSYPYDGADAAFLESFPNPMAKSSLIEIVAPEFTSLCPKTGQPDFARIIINYKPGAFCVESKSLKLYLGSFRQHKAFHESCVQKICDDLVALLAPQWLSVKGEFTPRGGIPFWPTAEYTAGDSIIVEGPAGEQLELDV